MMDNENSRPVDPASTAAASNARRSWIAATLSLPYLLLFLWWGIGSNLSQQGSWPSWKKHSLGYFPEEGLSGFLATVVIMSFWCFPVPLLAVVAAVYSCVTGFRAVASRRVVLCWMIPLVLALLAMGGVITWSLQLALAEGDAASLSGTGSTI